MENPTKMDDLGVPLFFRNQHMNPTISPHPATPRHRELDEKRSELVEKKRKEAPNWLLKTLEFSWIFHGLLADHLWMEILVNWGFQARKMV